MSKSYGTELATVIELSIQHKSEEMNDKMRKILFHYRVVEGE